MDKEEFRENIKQKLCTLYDGGENMFAREAAQVKIIFRPESKNFEKYIEQNQDKTIYIELRPDDFKHIARLVNVKEFESDDDKVVLIEVMVSEEDYGKIIGKAGRNINAIRTLVQASSYLKDNKRVKINVEKF